MGLLHGSRVKIRGHMIAHRTTLSPGLCGKLCFLEEFASVRVRDFSRQSTHLKNSCGSASASGRVLRPAYLCWLRRCEAKSGLLDAKLAKFLKTIELLKWAALSTISVARGATYEAVLAGVAVVCLHTDALSVSCNNKKLSKCRIHVAVYRSATIAEDTHFPSYAQMKKGPVFPIQSVHGEAK